MQTAIVILAALATGILVPLQLAFNAQLGQITKGAVPAALIIFVIGAAALSVVMVISRQGLPPLSDLRAAPPTVWLGGVIATLYILAVVWVTPQLGVAATAVLIITGQLVMAVLLDHLGAFGLPQISLSPMRAIGLMLAIGGAVAIRWG